MSALARRVALRTIPRSRGYATADLSKATYSEKQAAQTAHAAQTTELWRKISFYVCLPTIAVSALWVKNLEDEHAEHEAHVRAENDGHLPEPPRYDYLNKRAKPYPWGVNSLFFNSHVQRDLTAE